MSIQIDDRDRIYVADRENGRVQYFDTKGTYLGEFNQYGKTFGLKVVGDAICSRRSRAMCRTCRPAG